MQDHKIEILNISEDSIEIVLRDKKALIEKGKQFIYPELQSAWEKEMSASPFGDYSGVELEKIVNILEVLETESYTPEETANILKHRDYSGFSVFFLIRYIFEYSKKGPEFLKCFFNNKLDSNMLSTVARYIKRNALLEQNAQRREITLK